MTVVTEATTLPIDRLETKLPDKAPSASSSKTHN